MKQNSHKKFYLVFGTIVWVFTLFYFAHFFFMENMNPYTSGTFEDKLNAAFSHMISAPFELNPFPSEQLMLVFIVLLVGTVMIWINERKKTRMMPGIEEGSADWNKNPVRYNKKYTEPKGKPNFTISDVKNNVTSKNMILQNDTFLSMDTRQTLRNNNILVIGGSGAGKSRFFVKPNLLQKNCSYVITDPSGELLESCGGFLEKQGYKVKIFNLVEMEYSDHYNPFNYIRDDNGVLMMINCLIQNTTPPGASKGDPFWEKSETALLLAICFYLHYEIRKEDRNFANVMKLLLKAQVKEDKEDFKSVLDIMFEELEKKNKDHIAVRYYKIFKMGAGKTLKSILISATVRLGTFNLKAVQQLTNVDTIDLMTVGDEPTALFVVIPSADTTFNYLVSMMYSQLFESLYFHAENECKGKRLPSHVRFMLDEFANIGTIPDFEKKLATMRKYEISCSIIIQNMAQLKTMYKDAWESITGNCDTMLFLGGQEQTTLETVSKKLGKKTILSNGYTRSRGGQGSRSESENVKGRDLMTPDEIARMDNSMCICFIRGELPFYSKKFDYPKHPNYPLTGDADDNLLYDYRDPKRFTIPEKKKPVKRKKTTTQRDRLKKDGRDAGTARGPESTTRKRKVLHEATGGKNVTPENIAKTIGTPVETTTPDVVAEHLEPIGGFVADFEFQGAESYHSDFLGKDVDNQQEEKTEAKQELSSQNVQIESSEDTKKEQITEEVLKEEITPEPVADAEPDEVTIPDEFGEPEESEETGVMTAGFGLSTQFDEDDGGDNGPQITEDSDDTDDDGYSWE